MATNRGKQFETIVRKSFENVPNTSVVRLHDQTTGYIGSSNHCDFIVYHYPYEYHIECKSVHGNTLSFRNITDTQWNGLLKKSKIDGVFAGILCWWIDKDKTLFIPIQVLQICKYRGWKSIRYDVNGYHGSIIEIKGKKKRVFFDYDMSSLFEKAPDVCSSCI